MDRVAQIDSPRFLRYRSTLNANRELFLINHRVYLDAFFALDENLRPIEQLLRTGRDADGRSHVSLVPFLFLFQRQVSAAFDTMSSDTCYQAWLLFRPGLEAALIMGKWLDDPEAAEVWSNRASRRKEYSAMYRGKGLRSDSLPSSAALQQVLGRINDEFVHANSEYYRRHLRVREGAQHVDIELSYFDSDDVQEAHLLALLNTAWTAVEALAAGLATRLRSAVTLPYPGTQFREKFGPRARSLLDIGDAAWILRDLGMWSAESEEGKA